MIEKRNIEAFLKVNGLPPTAKDEEIREVLLSARWDNNEVDTALMVLKANVDSNKTHIDTLHKVFNSDDRLSPAEISSLLGIDVALTNDDVNNVHLKQARAQKYLSYSIFFLAFVIALSSITYMMYVEKAGFFHTNNQTSVGKVNAK